MTSQLVHHLLVIVYLHAKFQLNASFIDKKKNKKHPPPKKKNNNNNNNNNN